MRVIDALEDYERNKCPVHGTFTAFNDNGVVLLLDALGMSNADSHEAKRFADVISLAHDLFTYSKSQDLLFGKVSKYFENSHMADEDVAIIPDIRIFGDSVLCFWPIRGNTYAAFVAAALWSRCFVTFCMVSGYLFRGAITVGNVVRSKKAMLGPAVTDVASWYEAADGCGVIVCPVLEQAVELWIASSEDSGDCIPELLLSTDAFNRHGDNHPHWCLAWPHDFTGFSDGSVEVERDTTRSYLLFLWQSLLKKSGHIPYEAANKFRNTKRFVEEYDAAYREEEVSYSVSFFNELYPILKQREEELAEEHESQKA